MNDNDTRWVKAPSNKTPLTKSMSSMNLSIWIAGTSNQLFIKDS